MRPFDAALQASLYGRKQPSVPEVLASFGANARGWWTVYDPALPSDPGITLSSGAVQSWQDQLNGFVLSALGASQRPSYAADGSNFGGRPVVQTAASSTRILQGTFGSAWLAGGERLAMFTAMRLRTSAHFVFLYEVSDGTTDRGIWFYTDTSNSSFNAGPNGGVLTLAGELDVTPHVTLVHMRATANKRLELQPEGVSTTYASTAALAGQLTQVTLGARRTPSGPGDWSIAEVIGCRDLSDAQAASVVAAMRAKWTI